MIYGLVYSTIYLFLLQNKWIDKENNTLQEDLEYLTLEVSITYHSFEACMYNTTE